MRSGKGVLLALSGILVTVIVVTAIATGPTQEGERKPRDVTLTGRIVDLHSYMTGKNTSSDPVRSTRAHIEAGVPVAIEVSDGLVVVGLGAKGPRKTLARLAYQKVELKGRLYERGGLRYIDMIDAKPATAPYEPDDEQTDEPDVEDAEEDESDEPEVGAAGACCLTDGSCVDTYEDDCAGSFGEFYSGSSCDEIECDG